MFSNCKICSLFIFPSITTISNRQSVQQETMLTQGFVNKSGDCEQADVAKYAQSNEHGSINHVILELSFVFLLQSRIPLRFVSFHICQFLLEFFLFSFLMFDRRQRLRPMIVFFPPKSFCVVIKVKPAQFKTVLLDRSIP